MANSDPQNPVLNISAVGDVLAAASRGFDNLKDILSEIVSINSNLHRKARNLQQKNAELADQNADLREAAMTQPTDFVAIEMDISDTESIRGHEPVFELDFLKLYKAFTTPPCFVLQPLRVKRRPHCRQHLTTSSLWQGQGGKLDPSMRFFGSLFGRNRTLRFFLFPLAHPLSRLSGTSSLCSDSWEHKSLT